MRKPTHHGISNNNINKGEHDLLNQRLRAKYLMDTLSPSIMAAVDGETEVDVRLNVIEDFY